MKLKPRTATTRVLIPNHGLGKGCCDQAATKGSPGTAVSDQARASEAARSPENTTHVCSERPLDIITTSEKSEGQEWKQLLKTTLISETRTQKGLRSLRGSSVLHTTYLGRERLKMMDQTTLLNVYDLFLTLPVWELGDVPTCRTQKTWDRRMQSDDGIRIAGKGLESLKSR